MFAEVILSQRFPKHLGIFDYKVPSKIASKIAIGQLVSIPFRNSQREGVVIKLKQTAIAGKTIKTISDIYDTTPLLTEHQISLAEWLAKYYFVSLGTVIKTILPTIPKRTARIKKITYHYSPPPPVAEKKINDLVNKLSRVENGSFLLFLRHPREKLRIYHQLIKNKSGQTLIIVPEIADIDPLTRLVPPSRHPTIAVFHSQLNKTAQYHAYRAIRSGRAKIIIGTKLVVFAPLQRLQRIIIDQEENYNHKQSDQNPRFDARTTAEKLAALHRVPLLLTSLAPTVNAYYRCRKNNQKIIPSQSKFPPVIIDMGEERRSGNYSILSDKLTEQINKALSHQKKVLLFINKRGSASSVVCQDCGQIFTCPACQQPYIWHEKRNILYCHHCNQKHELPQFCTKCSGTHFKFLGNGTQKVERVVKKEWPQARIARFDADSEPNQKINRADIIIGTERIMREIDWRAVGLIGVISSDILLHLPDYRASERTWQLLRRLQYQAASPMIIQTYSPDHPAIRAIKTDNAAAFYESDLADRRVLVYPPFINLIKLVYRHRDKAACLAEAQRLYRLLKSSPINVSLLTPLSGYQSGKWQFYIIIKFTDKQKSLLTKMLQLIPDSWIIDRDPINLL